MPADYLSPNQQAKLLRTHDLMTATLQTTFIKYELVTVPDIAPTAAPDLIAHARTMFAVHPDGNSFVLRSDTNQTFPDWLDGLRISHPHLFKTKTTPAGARLSPEQLIAKANDAALQKPKKH